MPPRSRSHGGSDDGGDSHGNGGDGSSGSPSQRHGRIDASANMPQAQDATMDIAERGRSGGAAAQRERDLDPTPRPGETPEQAAQRVEDAKLQQAVDTYNDLGDDPPRINLRENDATHGDEFNAHTTERHGPDVPLNRGDAPPGDRTIEGRIHGDPPWGRQENWSYRWADESTMHRTVNDYVQANWDAIRSDLALHGEHSGFFDAGHRTGEGFYNEGMYGSGPRSSHYDQTSHARVVLTLDGNQPPGVVVVTAFPAAVPPQG